MYLSSFFFEALKLAQNCNLRDFFHLKEIKQKGDAYLLAYFCLVTW